jgi:hypothetical protein
VLPNQRLLLSGCGTRSKGNRLFLSAAAARRSFMRDPLDGATNAF